MRIKINPDFAITRFKEGIILTNINNNQSYHIDNRAYELIKLASGNYVCINDLYHSDYPEEEFKSFVTGLIEINFLLVKVF
ncbi:hypothetical protein [Oceanobacillus sp. 1P07AA]|uniref:hypothetical protein n=1 Tax=Oceanobacillus sp. 1P07AA TaxID=3132293 RepID=UPI0039A5761B